MRCTKFVLGRNSILIYLNHRVRERYEGLSISPPILYGRTSLMRERKNIITVYNINVERKLND